MKSKSSVPGSAFGHELLALAVIAAIMLLADPCSAHRVRVFAYVEGDTVRVEGYFSKTHKAMNCPVEVFDSRGRKILTGKTDRDGRFSFPVADLKDVRGGLKIVLVAGEGHRAAYLLGADELPAPRKTEPESSHGGSVVGGAEPPKTSTSEVGSSGPLDLKQVERMIKETVKQENKPIIRMLGQQEKLLIEMRDRGPGLRDIVGGIGWILGILGVAAYFMSRNRKR
jgi:nickel transport protein